MNQICYLDLEGLQTLLKKNVGRRRVADTLVLVDAVREGLFVICPNINQVYGTQPLKSCREEAHFRTARFLRIMSHPDLHFDLREMICSFACNQDGFVAQRMLGHSSEDLLSGLMGLRRPMVAEREKSKGLVPAMTFGVRRFITAAAIVGLLHLGLSILVLIFVNFFAV